MVPFLLAFVYSTIYVAFSDEYVLKIIHANGELDAYDKLSVLVQDFLTNATLGQTETIDNAVQKQWDQEYTVDGPHYLSIELMNGDETIGQAGLAIGIGEVTDCQHILPKEIDLGGIDLFVEIFKNCDADADVTEIAVHLLIDFLFVLLHKKTHMHIERKRRRSGSRKRRVWNSYIMHFGLQPLLFPMCASLQ